MTTTVSISVPQVFIDLMDDLSSDNKAKNSIWDRSCSLALDHPDYESMLAACDGKAMVERTFSKMEREYYSSTIKHVSKADYMRVRNQMSEALNNSTYRSIKAVIKTATDYGVSLIDDNKKIKGKSAVEREYRAKKIFLSETKEVKVTKAKERLLEMRGIATQLVNSASKDRDTSLKILTELAVEVRGLDSYLAKLISNYQFEESN